MAKRDFNEWRSHFIPTISGYSYYVDFDKVSVNVDSIKTELNIMNSLMGSKNICEDFVNLATKYPEIRKCIPILLAIREKKFDIRDNGKIITYDLSKHVNSIEELSRLMSETGLFKMMENRLINLVDYVYGVETGLDSNARKNRGGHQMEDLVEGFIRATGKKYFKEMYLSEIESRYGLDLSAISNKGSTRKRFDFVVESNNHIFAFEVNFYTSSGSKLNETARSYKMLAEESRGVNGFTFVWVTDGCGWKDAQNNLRETFDVLDTLYSIHDLESGVLSRLFDGVEIVLDHF